MIKRIKQSDKELFLTLSREFYRSEAVLHDIPEEYHKRTFDELMRSQDYAQGYLLCLKEGTPVGYALTAKTFSHEAGGTVIWVEEIYIRPEFRGKGLGKSFFRYVDTLGAARLRLEAEQDNDHAITLYRALGYKPLPYVQMIKERK
ncbi:MAG: GNAT family N-acetyltransferase [Clostridia bacterium]|jgi:GNAT superfamily N-acetyltransferase|nr:GNAT family N-acetyltransferase [Clostridia bacterium]